jgi:ubiquitin-conjugating enzyme E2 variant
MLALEIIGKIVLCVFITDFLSGLLHWLEDAYGNEDWPITGRLITRPNILHHYDPRYFTRYSWLYSARVLLAIGAVILMVAYWGGFLNWMTLLVVAIGVNANEIHKWAHRTRAENGPVITFFQQIGVLQSPVQHGNHHRGTKDTYYCVITDYLNPVLERLRFWPTLEWLIAQLFGVHRRPDHSVKVEERGVRSVDVYR